ncbi:MAG: TIGR03032 family protein [Gemmobacter sp.]
MTNDGDSAPPYAVHASPGFAGWLHAAGAALAVTTYQIGKLFLIGAPTPDTLSVSERNFDRCLGVAAGPDGMLLAGRNAIWRLANLVPAGHDIDGHDGVFVPRTAWFTGDVQAHDVGHGPGGLPLFVNTAFSCLAAIDEGSSFRSVWKPPFISALAPQDRCHLNGLACDAAGWPRYLTAAAETDAPRGWSEQREGAGVVIDAQSGETLCRGLTMPHSPRLHDGALFVLNAGTGELGRIDRAAARFDPVAFLPGFARGLAFLGGRALVGLSLPRASPVFAGLPLERRLAEAGYAAQCAVAVVNLETGEAEHVLRLGGQVRELYDIAILPGLRRPMLVGTAPGGPLDRLVLRGSDLDLMDRA